MQVLFETDSRASDSLSYDLSAWALPYVFNLKAFAVTDKILADTGKVGKANIVNMPAKAETYAYVANYTALMSLNSWLHSIIKS